MRRLARDKGITWWHSVVALMAPKIPKNKIATSPIGAKFFLLDSMQ